MIDDFHVCENQIEVWNRERNHLDEEEEEEEDALGCDYVPQANKSAGYMNGTVCTKPVLSVVSITADERRKHARLVGKRKPF